jgi:hypothetical protein|tara:strand:+ start:741 stop:950 length:210 start_codon:yes stop_codon:yes gene_type:complete
MENVKLSSSLFDEVRQGIVKLQKAQILHEDNRLLGEKDILYAKLLQAEKELIKSTISFFDYLEESKITF